MRAALLLCALAPAACCGLAPRAGVEVREVARSLYCNTAGEAPQLTLLPDAQAVAAWQSARGIALAAAGSLAPAPHAAVEMGMRSTGGYDLSVSAQGVLRGDALVLQVTFSAPAPGSLRTQALSSPCVLVQLPPGRYAGVELRDAAGGLLARGGTQSPAGAPER
jgi:hypothetical protein